jgi:hypothetical protein
MISVHLGSTPKRWIYPAAIGDFTALPRERGVPFLGFSTLGVLPRCTQTKLVSCFSADLAA